ncbi:conserved hypothetical protein [Leishmania braziliensis MHOM/BR/75/M2904]|uniref:Enriched in surface-labeled proteome protein 9 n=2 Tax=Leishmania braziliensis TaxID=5660 RepID=A4HN48_LEIBR|nr:conserved hypothetical protein [Leishmania braziliensis MHOM/BR/75/M2904]CAJ2480633.1 unnamed protein product [Leishmania braziliensis]CAM43592.1 conserved hypothetical protein [Leishmania braziliensis MHOM/BR/75/M2904]SYZ69649.1 Enriched_in_surface-labeled_proteome_protein_9 [Leishmania braziliensis MHOM/BR/75/M2904]
MMRTSFASLMATLLALLSMSVAVSAANLLPLYGRGLFDVELVCRSAAPSAPMNYNKSVISAFRLSVSASANRTEEPVVFPFSMERTMDSDYIHTYYINATDKYTVSDMDGCMHTKGSYSSSDDVLLAQSLVGMLQAPLPTTFTTSTIRGIVVKNYSNHFSLIIPVKYGGLGTSATYSAAVLTSTQGWSANLMQVSRTAVSIEVTAVTASTINNCLFTFSFFGSNVSDAVMPPSHCESVSPSPAHSVTDLPMNFARSTIEASVVNARSSSSSSSTSASTRNSNMPDFPADFSANFLVISPSQKSFYHLRAAFSLYAGISRASLQYPMSGVAGRVYEYEWFTNSWDQMSYYYTKFAVPDGEETADKALREYFFPDQNTCKRILIGYDKSARSVSALLLYSPSVPPTFIGNQTVRNIPCGVWAAEVNGVRVMWYWATSDLVDTTSFWTNESVDSGVSKHARLVRMTVSGRGGAPPLFVHHPFFPQGYAFPAPDRSLACKVMLPDEVDISCDGHTKDADFTHIYDIMSYVPYVRRNDYRTPLACNGIKTSGSIPSFQCNYNGVRRGVVAALLIVVSLLFSLVSGCCVWCPFSRIVRQQQRELVRFTQELGHAQSANDVEGQDEANRGATCGLDNKYPSSLRHLS